jgi:hypothetical protein
MANTTAMEASKSTVAIETYVAIILVEEYAMAIVTVHLVLV